MLGFYYVVSNVSRVAIFPGSSSLYLLFFEQDKEIALASTILKRLNEFKASLVTSDFVFGYEALTLLIRRKEPLKSILKILCLNSSIQLKDSKLTASQDELTVYINQIRAQMKSVIFKVNESEIKLSKLKERDVEYSTAEARVENADQLQLLVNHCNALIDFLSDIVKEKKWFDKIKRLFTSRALGHLQYMRAETVRLYNAEQVSIRAKDGKVLDGVIIPAREIVRDFQSIETRSVALLCNPNAGFYEFAVDHQSRWMKFYANRNFDICCWNYRGYGRSQGSPNPFNIVSDALDVLNFLRTEKGYTRILVHGESLGGAVAVKLGKRGGCDFIFADRTFCSIKDEGELIVGKLPYKLMKWVTGWKLDIAEDYINANCYKLIGNDANDLVINELASLRSGVSRFAVIFCMTC
eukprot:TRINITY_DN10828_c0_g2_i1.p1 TRINITY_DN10828_c0_g2~~TRINITY_DN10828_c0_g2_i1.p1  ORF type:complete len:410 (-),score=75.09 TRINITY_DN10828_c0_g2_i1:1275-2504(-)